MYVFCYQQQEKSSKHVQFGSVQNKQKSFSSRFLEKEGSRDICCKMYTRGGRLVFNWDRQEQWFSKFFCFFLYSPITNPIPKHCQFLLIKYHKRCWQKYTTTHCEETREDYEPNRPFITSDITVKASCTCKLLRLLPDMVRLIMELDGNCSFTLTTANGGKMSRLPRLKAAVSQGSGLTRLLVNIYTSYILTGIKPAELRSQTNRIVSSTLGHGVWTPAPLSAHVHRVQMHGVSNWNTHLSSPHNN